MSGALIQLVSKGVQDVYLMTEEGHSFFRIKFTRHTNFSQAPKYLKSINDTDNTITIPVLGAGRRMAARLHTGPSACGARRAK